MDRRSFLTCWQNIPANPDMPPHLPLPPIPIAIPMTAGPSPNSLKLSPICNHHFTKHNSKYIHTVSWQTQYISATPPPHITEVANDSTVTPTNHIHRHHASPSPAPSPATGRAGRASTAEDLVADPRAAGYILCRSRGADSVHDASDGHVI